MPELKSVDSPALLPRSFYSSDPITVARQLLGKILVRPGAPDLVGRIVETEAYFAGTDPAAHAFAGKTARNAVLFGPPGHAYVYFIYGMHSCLNVSCEPNGEAGGVLIRALQPLSGLEVMAERRQVGQNLRLLTSGPGRLCQAFAITRAKDNGADYTSEHSALQIRDDGFVPGEVLVTPRIGITKAADTLARFFLAGNLYVSRR
jgi:DNA-3-methyladenine glycosylase